MQLAEKQELVRLLNLYQADLLWTTTTISGKPQSTRVRNGKVLTKLV